MEEGADGPAHRLSLRRRRALLRSLREALRRPFTEQRDPLAALAREHDQLVYAVSHDLRGPLQALTGYAGLLEDTCGDRLEDEARDCVDRIHRAVDQVSTMLEELTWLSRARRWPIAPEVVDLADLARAAYLRRHRAEPDRRVELSAEGNLSVRGDRRLLAALVERLMDNAWKFTAPRANARIEVGRRGGARRNEFFVRDDGVGFASEDADRVFGPFERSHGRSQFDGFGIGLATARVIVERHGGQVRAEGRVDVGATIYFTLPLA